jgi:hypothetical protein
MRIGFDKLDRLLAGGGRQNPHPAPLQHAAQRKDVAGIVVDQENGSIDKVLIGTVQPLQHALLFGRQVGDDAVQEESGLVQQAFGRLHAFHDNAARHPMKPGIFFRTEFSSGEHDNRHVGQPFVSCKLFQHLEPCHVG